MGHVKVKVEWHQERANETDDNNGKHYGFYVMDCLKEDYDEYAGAGAYDVLESYWFETIKERDTEYDKYKK